MKKKQLEKRNDNSDKTNDLKVISLFPYLDKNKKVLKMYGKQAK